MATLLDYVGITKLRDAWPKWKANIIAVNNQVIAHVAGTADKHAAQDITYTGDFAGKTEVKAALDQAKTEIDTIVVNASIDPEVAFARDSAVKSKVFGSLDDRLEESEQDRVTDKAETAAELGKISIGKSNGIDDTSMINASLSTNNYVRGLPGATYLISAPLIIGPNTTIDMTGCNINWITGVTGNNLLRNVSNTPERTISDAAIITGSTTLTSTTAMFTSSDVGRTVCVTGAGGTIGVPVMLTADIVSITNGTTVTLAIAGKVTVTDATCNIYNRDTNITIKGGVWNRGSATGSTSLALHGLSLKHIDYLSIDIEAYNSSSVGAKYAICLGDVRYATVICRYFNTISDGLHIIGPCSHIDVPYLAGTTNDDFFALTGADYPSYSDTAGDITDIHVGVLQMNNCLAGLKILAGSGNLIDNLEVEFSSGTTSSYGCWMGTDVNYPDTTGGSYGKLDFGRFAIKSDFDLFRMVDVTADEIKVAPIGTAANQLVRILANTTNVGGTINTLIIDDANVPNSINLFRFEGTTNILNNLQINNVRINGSGYIANLVSGTVTKATITNSNIVYNGTTDIILLTGATIGDIKFVDTNIDMSGTTAGLSAVIHRSSGVGVSSIETIRCNITGSGPTRGFLGYSPCTNPFTVNLDSTNFINCKRILDSVKAIATVHLKNVNIGTALEPLYCSAGGFTLLGDITSLTTATTLIDSASTGVFRVNGRTLPVVASMLTPQLDDIVHNSAATSASGWYQGSVVHDGSKWIPLRGYAVSGTATLVSGTVTVANNTRITSLSRIRVSQQTPYGTTGAIWVDSITAGAGFTIKSISSSDASVVRYEIITY